MDKNEMMVAVAAILTTALEIDNYYFPESTAYLALGGDIQKWEIVKSVLLKGELITCNGYQINLTPKGRLLATELNARLSKAV